MPPVPLVAIHGAAPGTAVQGLPADVEPLTTNGAAQFPSAPRRLVNRPISGSPAATEWIPAQASCNPPPGAAKSECV